MRHLTFLSAAVVLFLPLSAGASTPVNLQCMQQAVAIRESSMLTGFSTYTQKVMTAFQARMTGLQSAWANTNEDSRKETIKNTWTTYNTALKDAQKQLQTTRKSVWNTFKDARKTCGGSSYTDPGGGESSDAKL
jgi:hypothetical protein